ncbi:MAG: hypothetical protein ACLFNP_06295 [Spirochaetaceae bacterium]
MKPRLLLLPLVAAMLLSGCDRHETTEFVELWTDQPLMALYAELYNAEREQTKVKVVFRTDVAEAVLTEGGEPDVIIGRGLANRNLAEYMQELPSTADDAAERIYPDLLALGRYRDALRFLPLSFDLPAVQFLDVTLPEQSTRRITIDELRTRGEAFNELESERYVRMGFSPLWDERFLLAWAQLQGTAFTEIAELRVAWDQSALEQLLESGVSWRQEVNGGNDAAEAFSERYLYDPAEKLLRRGRIGFYYTTAGEFLSRPDRETRDMSIRWLSGDEAIPVLPEIVYAAIPNRAQNRRQGVDFLRWLLDPAVQQRLMETSTDRQIDSFGFLRGLSSLPEVNRTIITEIHPALLGSIPPTERLAFPRRTPLNWSVVEEDVVGPWLRESIRLHSGEEPRAPDTDLGEAIDQWYRARGL